MSNFFINHYLKHNLRNEILELYFSVAIKNFAFSMITIFEPIYLFKLYGSLSIVLLYYLSTYILYFFIVPLAILYFLILSQLPTNGFLIIFAVLFLIIYKVLFWPSYHTDFAHYSSKEHQGKELGALFFISTIVTIIGPIIGGIILTKFGFEVLFVIISIISLISTIPLFITSEKFQTHDFSYKKAFRRLIKPYNQYKRKNSIALFGYGEETIAMIIWPIFIFLVLEKFYLIGLISGIIIFLISLSNLYIGKVLDVLNKKGKKNYLFQVLFFTQLLSFCVLLL